MVSPNYLVSPKLFSTLLIIRPHIKLLGNLHTKRFSADYLDLQSTQNNGLHPKIGAMGHCFGYLGGPGRYDNGARAPASYSQLRGRPGRPDSSLGQELIAHRLHIIGFVAVYSGICIACVVRSSGIWLLSCCFSACLLLVFH